MISEEGRGLERHRVESDPELRRTKYVGAAFIVGSFVMAYFFMWRPVQAAKLSGYLEYSVKAVLLTPLLAYLGVAMLLTDMRDGETRRTGADGKARLTRKGWLFVAGMMVVIAVTLGAGRCT